MKGKTLFQVILIFFSLICISQSKKLKTPYTNYLDPKDIKEKYFNGRIVKELFGSELDYTLQIIFFVNDMSIIASSDDTIKELPKYKLTVNGKKVVIDEKKELYNLLFSKKPNQPVSYRILNRSYDLVRSNRFVLRENSDHPLYAKFFHETAYVILTIRRFKQSINPNFIEQLLDDDINEFLKYYHNYQLKILDKIK